MYFYLVEKEHIGSLNQLFLGHVMNNYTIWLSSQLVLFIRKAEC